MSNFTVCRHRVLPLEKTVQKDFNTLDEALDYADAEGGTVYCGIIGTNVSINKDHLSTSRLRKFTLNFVDYYVDLDQLIKFLCKAFPDRVWKVLGELYND